MYAKYNYLKENAWCGIWGKRILSELYYLLELSKANDNCYQSLLVQCMDKLYDYVNENGSITRQIAEELEKDLSAMAALAKSLSVILVGHAHIDMNWMWGFQETATLTVDTFTTMLQLMEEYPEFTFSQSQASVYRIVEEYHPQLLEQIRKRVKEGRWEVNATTWVENDKNLSGSESMARHILYTREYLSKLLDLPAEEFCLDFEPDTFGHNENMPEVLSQGGIKYYYHCRGYNGEFIYRWQAPSGAEVLVYREPMWYNDPDANYDAFGYVPAICKRYGLSTALKFYGVGDHGGGPTRREIDHWLEMQSWPLMPTLKFGTLKEFFRTLESVRDTLPIVKQELNYVFTGCYTSQARIKRANMVGEHRLYESELLDTLAGLSVPQYCGPGKYDKAWEKILFNQFHDILPGSGVRETREYALGEFQSAMAISQINQKHAMTELCKHMDTRALGTSSGSLGGGAGFGTDDATGCFASYAEQGGGIRRLVTVFNTTPYSRTEPAKVVLWDWPGNVDRLCATDTHGNEVPCQILDQGTLYWGHHYHTVLLMADVPSMGYNSYILDEGPDAHFGENWGAFFAEAILSPRIDQYTDAPLVLENDLVKAVFAPDTMKLQSFVDKKTGCEQIKTPACAFRLITEDVSQGMSAWRVGNYAKIVDLNETHPVHILSHRCGVLEESICYQLSFAQSSLKVTVGLRKNSSVLDFTVQADWHELGTPSSSVPQLNFTLPLGYEAPQYLCNIPMGMITRAPLAQDVPCTGFMAGVPVSDRPALVLMSDCKYGFRGYADSINVTLLRGSYDPDPAPDQGLHTIALGIGIAPAERTAFASCYEQFVHPLVTCGNQFHAGTLPTEHSWLRCSETVRIQAVKQAQNHEGFIIRLQNLFLTEQNATIQTCRPIAYAELTDISEVDSVPLTVTGNTVSVPMDPAALRSLRIILK